jgi:citryl-CoA lyase
MSSEAKYWSTSISKISPERVVVRGYDLEDLIGIPFGAATFLLMRGRLPSPNEARVVDALLTAVLDYGLEKAGTVAARAIVSSNPDMQAGLAGAVLAAGEHSLAPEGAAQFIADQHEAWKDSGLGMEEFAEQVVSEFSARRARIPGFGHPVFRGTDPRAEKLRAIAVSEGLWGEPAQLYECIHRAFVRNPKVAHFPINDVGVLAAVAVAMGFTPKETTALAVVGTLPGIAAHVTEEITTGKLVRRVLPEDVDYNVEDKHFATDFSKLGWAADDARV